MSQNTFEVVVEALVLHVQVSEDAAHILGIDGSVPPAEAVVAEALDSRKQRCTFAAQQLTR
ncbi:hypothetical protein H7097_00755 [Aeromicrobium sp.]|nr:hypothetical protein [Candidatus Saccharibacteria bacterium]